MMEKKKVVGLIAQSQSTSSFIRQQLVRFLEAYLEVKTWCIDNENTLPEHFDKSCDLYLCSNNSVYAYATKHLTTEKKVILARRTVNVENLHKILEIVSGEKVLVVTTTKETANNTIEILQGLGIWHIEFETYWPRCEKIIANDVKIAITTGLAHLVPPHISKIIDIGGKGVDISTFCEILQTLDIPMHILDSISNYYLKAILRNNMQIRDSALQNEKLGKNLTKILDNVFEGIVAIDSKRKIIFHNPAISELFGTKEKKLIDKDIREIINEFKPELFKVDAKQNAAERVVAINNRHYALRTYTLEGRLMGIDDMTVISLFPADTLQEMDKKVRSALKYKGNNAKYDFTNIIGSSATLERTLHLAKRFAKTELTMLIEGESGTGKELLAHAIHNHSQRAQDPFVAVNFASIPENLVESILFGYEEGAFTGSKKGGSAGLFEEAHRGTIFLDELSSASLDIQNRLLRVLEESEIRRVGGNALIPVNVRIIAAANIPLSELVEQGLFRQDLFYRICAAPVSVPPLRERTQDIPLLIEHFSQEFSWRQLAFDRQLLDFFFAYSWPGNIRELNNVVKYIYNVCEKDTATLADLPDYIFSKKTLQTARSGKQSADENSGGSAWEELTKQPDKAYIICQLLNILWSAKVFKTKLGRQQLQKRLAEQNIVLSEHKMKYWLHILVSQGLAQTGVTRQGIWLTDKGKALLDYLQASNSSAFR